MEPNHLQTDSPSPLPKSAAKLRVDRELCQTATTCLAFRFFELDDEAKAVILTKNGQDSETPGNPCVDQNGFIDLDQLLQPEDLTESTLSALALESAMLCPFGAIIVQDQDGNQLWPLESPHSKLLTDD
jgi:ferredoxin